MRALVPISNKTSPKAVFQIAFGLIFSCSAALQLVYQNGYVRQAVVVVHRFGGELVDAVIVVVNALGIVDLASVAPEHRLAVVVGADLDSPREKRTRVILVVDVINARFRVREELLHAL